MTSLVTTKHLSVCSPSNDEPVMIVRYDVISDHKTFECVQSVE